MERREPPRMATADATSPEAGGGPPPYRRFPRFSPGPGPRRPALPRIGLALLAVAGASALVLVLGSFVTGRLVAYLHGQPQYRFEFRDIILDPPPPAWFRGGAPALLERVRQNAAELEGRSVLDLDLDRVLRAFRLDCWVEKADRIAHRPTNRVSVRLAYREPVASYVPSTALPPGRWILVDRDAVILPAEDVEADHVLGLIRLEHVRPPFNPKPGEVWKRPGGVAGEAEVDDTVRAGARLAAFLRPLATSKGDGPDARITHIHAEPSRDLWVQFGGNVLFCWKSALGQEVPGELSAEAKRDQLRDWIERYDPAEFPAGRTRHFVFTKGGIVPHQGPERH